MDKIIENLIPLVLEWQQIVIENIGNGFFLVTLTFFVAMLMTGLILKSVASGLRRQLLNEKINLVQSENKCAELVKVQKHDAEKMAELQQNHDQIKDKFQIAETEYSQLRIKQQQLSKSLLTKQKESDELVLALNEKTQSQEKLQSDFDAQKVKLSQLVVSKLKVDEIERNAEQIEQEAGQVKRQIQHLEEELEEKNQLIKGLDNSDFANKINKDKIAVLEAKISQLKDDNINQRKPEKEANKTDYAKELENTVKQHDQQLIEFNKKLQLLITSTIPDTPINDLTSGNKKDEGFVGKVLHLFASIDKASEDESDLDGADKISTKNEDIWQQHHDIIEQLTHQLIAEENDKEALFEAENNQTLSSSSESEIEENISEKNVELNSEQPESLDSIQHKLKDIYNKIIS